MLKKRMLGAALVVGLGVSMAPAHAQRGPGRVLEPGPHMGRSLELALEHQADLGLTGEQVSRLSELKAGMERDVLPLAEEMKALREGIRSGEIDRAEGFRQREAVRGELITAAAPLRGRVQEILTVEQHQRLQALVWQARPGVGRAGLAPMARPRGGAGMAPMGRPRAGAQLRRGWGGAGFLPGFGGQGRLFRRGWGGGAPLGS